MATTTNYGWTTPNDTDLVKDGAAAIRTLGSSVDTTTKALNPSTTLGDIEYRSSTANTNTRLAIGTTGQVLSVVGGVPAWATSDDANAIQNAIVDAKGDLISATAADTPARLAVGANGTVLTADSAEATGLKWATPASGGGMTLINSGGTTLTGASVSIGSIPSTYEMLILKIIGYSGATDGTTVRMRFNGDDSANSYRSVDIGNTSANYTFNATSGDTGANQDDAATSRAFSYITLPNYASTSTWKVAQVFGIGNWYTAATEVVIANTTIVYNQTAAISSIDLFPNSGNFDAGTAYLYGVK